MSEGSKTDVREIGGLEFVGPRRQHTDEVEGTYFNGSET
jgi:hypothetical protein